MRPSTTFPTAAILLLGSGVQSFRTSLPPTAVVRPSRTSFPSSADAAVVVQPKSIILLSAPPASSATSFALFSSPAPIDIDINDAELEDMRQQIANVTESLEQAKKRQDEAKEGVDQLKEEKSGILANTKSLIDMLKGGFVSEITDLSDQIEGAQDDLRKTKSKTVSEISAIQGQRSEREGPLKDEISELESRLESLRQDAEKAAKEREQVNKSIQKDLRDVRSASRKEMEAAKSAAFKEKKEMTRLNWALESKIQEANLVDTTGVMKELEEEKQVTPMIPNLKQKLMEMKRKFLPEINELKEQVKAKEISFDQSLKDVKSEKEDELDTAKTISEEELSMEGQKLENATSYFESLLEEKEKELQRAAEEAAESVEFAGFTAFSKAREDIADLIKGNADAIERQKEESANKLNEAKESQPAMQDQYDAEYENAKWNLKEQEARSQRKLQDVDEMRAKRRVQLTEEMGELTRKLSTLMNDEREASERDYQSLVQVKTTELDTSVSQSNAAMNEVQTMRSNLLFIRSELNRLEQTSEQNRSTLKELEEERSSFRKQVRRTVKVAFGRITRRG